uniref:Chromobox protein 3 n=1 Tax=Echinococcus granulosus TaxID=6210 RepID=A0A068WTP8_ECHGR|nr:Chromobox protein 3 [Echinococcus granulosus]
MRSSSSLKQKRKADDKAYLVDSIIDERYIKNQKYYKVRWLGFPPNEDSWEPEANLTRVRELIREFHLKNKSPSTSRQHSSTKKRPEVFSKAHSSKSIQEPPSPSKRRMTKSRTGHFEYVPQSELVAKKTKFFDDIRDGKIDLTLNDLYSRVKTRRRCRNDISGQNDDNSLSRPSSLTELNECRGALQTTPTRHSEPPTPKTFVHSANGSMDEAKSVIPDSTSSHLFQSQLHTSSKSGSSISKQISRPLSTSLRHVKRQYAPYENRSKRNISFGSCHFPASKTSVKDPAGDSSIGLTDEDPSDALDKIGFPSNSKKVLLQKDLEVHPEAVALSGVQESLEQAQTVATPTQSRPTVPSSSVLMSFYLDLTNRCSSHLSTEGEDLLSDFPIVQPLDEGVLLRSQKDLLLAINNQRWTLLATQPIEKIAADHTGPMNAISQHPLVAAIIGGEGRPFLLRRLLLAGNDPNFIDPISKWPLLLIAVYYGRIQAARVLLELGAQPNAAILVEGKRVTALGMAIVTGNIDMVSLLILSGANLYQVNDDASAAQFIIQILQAVASKTSYEATVKAPPGFTTDPKTIRRQLEELLKPPSIPIIEPSEGKVLPRSPYDFLSPPSSSTTPASTSLLISFDGQKPHLPSADSLHCMHRLVSSCHARLFIALDRVVTQWLHNVGMVVSSRLLPGQWIHLDGSSFTLNFPTPQNPATFSEASSVLVLFLVHGTVTPPGCYHVWLDDDGPCLVKRVLLGDVEQRPLARQYFVSTLLPIDYEKENQCICVYFSNTERGTCIAPLVLRLKPVTGRQLQNTSKDIQETAEMPPYDRDRINQPIRDNQNIRTMLPHYCSYFLFAQVFHYQLGYSNLRCTFSLIHRRSFILSLIILSLDMLIANYSALARSDPLCVMLMISPNKRLQYNL